MATILCVTRGLPSVLYPSVELARRLKEAGHRVVFGGDAGASELVEHHELEFLPLDPSHYDEFLETDAAEGLLHRLRTLRRRQALATESLAVQGFARALHELEPDLVLVNAEMHEQILTAMGAGLRVALLNSFVSIWRSPGLPPPHCLALPGVGWRGSRLGAALLWLSLRLRKRFRALRHRVWHVGCDRLTTLRQLARQTGVDLRRETDDSQWLKPFTYRRLPVLSLHAAEFELPHRPPRQVSYVGPMVLEERVDRRLAGKERARLDAVLARCRRAGGDRVLIYAGFGSVLTATAQLLHRLPEVVIDRLDWELVIGLGERAAAAKLEELSERVHAFAWAPQPELLRHADVVVTHGGIGTVDECVLAGVPVLVYCGGETDMAGTTSRVVYHGLGLAGDRRDDVAAIRGHLDRLLDEPGFRERVERQRSRLVAYSEKRVAERVVQALLDCAETITAPGGDGA